MGGLGRKFQHKLPDIEILRNLESPFILWIQTDIHFLASTNYGKLLGVSGLSIYNWEQGKARPRKSSADAWVAIRRIGKREAAKRLAALETPEAESEPKQTPAVK